MKNGGSFQFVFCKFTRPGSLCEWLGMGDQKATPLDDPLKVVRLTQDWR